LLADNGGNYVYRVWLLVTKPNRRKTKEKPKTRRLGLIGVLNGIIAGGEGRGNRYCDGSCKEHAVPSKLASACWDASHTVTRLTSLARKCFPISVMKMSSEITFSLWTNSVGTGSFRQESGNHRYNNDEIPTISNFYGKKLKYGCTLKALDPWFNLLLRFCTPYQKKAYFITLALYWTSFMLYFVLGDRIEIWNHYKP
jgi:hypothetical protein